MSQPPLSLLLFVVLWGLYLYFFLTILVNLGRKQINIPINHHPSHQNVNSLLFFIFYLFIYFFLSVEDIGLQ